MKKLVKMVFLNFLFLASTFSQIAGKKYIYTYPHVIDDSYPEVVRNSNKEILLFKKDSVIVFRTSLTKDSLNRTLDNFQKTYNKSTFLYKITENYIQFIKFYPYFDVNTLQITNIKQTYACKLVGGKLLCTIKNQSGQKDVFKDSAREYIEF